MFSLDKKYPCRGDELPTNLSDYIETPKLDGCAVSHIYLYGNYVQSLTRGDGIKGTDRSYNLRQLVPEFVEAFEEMPLAQVKGEVLCSKPVENIRNYASGAVNLKDPREFAERIKEGGLIFVAYGVQDNPERSSIGSYYYNDMQLLSEAQFDTCIDDEVLAMATSGQIPTDGIVYRLNSNAQFDKLGYTHKHPRGAFAVKEDAEGEITTVREVIWQVGKSGKVTPVAVFDEISLEGAKTTRATLNNVAYMQGIGLTEIGQQVRVIRAGGVIPKIVEVL